MTMYKQLHQFNQAGLEAFRKVFKGQLAESEVGPLDSEFVSVVEGTRDIATEGYETTKHMAQAILRSLDEAKLYDNVSNTGMWAWLTFILRDVLFKRDSSGNLIVGQERRWFPAEPKDYRNSTRHMVKMPVILLESFGDNADHMLCGPPNEVPKIRYELVRSQGMMNSVFQNVARTLYFDESTGKLKPGTGGIKRGGTAYRLAQVYKQLDVTWEIEDLEPDEFMSILPPEFNRFKPGNDDKDSVIRRIVDKLKP